MAFEFSPSTSIGTQAFQAPQNAQMGAPISGNTLASLADITNINATQQSTRASRLATQRARDTYEADVAKAQADSDTAVTGAKSAAVKLGNEQINSMYSVLTPYGSDPRVEAAGKLTPNSTPEEIKAVQNGLFDVSDEVKKQLRAKGWNSSDIAQYAHPFEASILQDVRKAPNEIKRATQTLAGALNIAEQNQPRFEKNAAGEFVQVTPAKGQVGNVGGSSANANPTSGGVASTNDYIKDLNLRNATALETDMRLGEAEGLLKLIKGGAGTKNFTEIARWAQAANLPTELVDSIAGGNISAVQSAQKFITQAVIQGATANPGTAESVNRFIKDNPDIGTDPRALDKFIKFTQKLNQKTFDETEFLLSKKKSGQFNPETHVQETQQYLRGKYLNPETKSSESKPSEGKQTVRKVVRTGKDSAGREVVQYDDGTIGYK
jgi:hypothetical protein